MSERERYVYLWEEAKRGTYGKGSIAYKSGVRRFLSRFKTKPSQSIIDCGCGTGRSLLKLAKKFGRVTLCDFAYNSLAPEVLDYKGRDWDFIVSDLYDLTGGKWNWVVSWDALEHIEEARIPKVMDNLVRAATTGMYLEICTRADGLGPELGVGPLHLTVKSESWWREQVAAALRRSGRKTSLFKAYHYAGGTVTSRCEILVKF